jgi:lytic murein transglycosylase
MRSVKAAFAVLMLAASPALAQSAGTSCSGGAGFPRWLEAFKAEAVRSGISQRVIEEALGHVAYDPNIIRRDRGQGVFAQDFLVFSDRMVNSNRIQRGAAEIRKNQATFARIQSTYGVPAAVITAFWALETDFGVNQGDFPIIPALATLAYDCRRPERFRPQLMDALRIVQRGDLSVAELRGGWAGEIGQTQFLPSDYYNRAVDFDGDGRKNLRSSVPDVLASTANVLKFHGWQANQPWLEEVRVPSQLPWDQADIAIRKPRSEWARLGVTRPDGRALPNDALPASLVLPMGRNGPAFLAYPNFAVYTEWNNSIVYATSAAYLATRLAGAPPIHRGTATGTGLNMAETKELQTLLQRRGYNVGKIDGILGAASRAAVKAEQVKARMPADSWPTPALLAYLRGR